MPPRPNLERREQLLDQLEAIFLAEGFLHLRIGGLAARLHCSRSTLYELADSKEELFVRVTERWADRTVNSAVAAAEESGDARIRVARFIHVIADAQSQGSMAFWREVYAFPPTAERFSEKRSWGIDALRDYLDEGVAAGVFRGGNTKFIAHLIWLASQAARDPDTLAAADTSPREAVLETGALLVYGMSLPATDDPAAAELLPDSQPER